ncbi:MAG: helix-turn-helix domain-containing protein, partial [Clostridia bacterium]|nr:helix-turn-helix domain-containing protein [Clostridia bacterium]
IKYSIIAMEHSEEFKQRFSELISDLDCKKSEIPKLLNIDYNVFGKITEFGIIPKPVILIRIADYFNISVEYLLNRTDNPYFVKAETATTFLERYQALKAEKNLTDYVITQKLHISTSYTTNWKNKKYIPSIINLIELSEYFKVSIDYLLGRTDDK